MKIKDLYNKYIHWIVIVLFVLLCFKGCQSCSRNRKVEYNKTQYEYVVDSLTNTIGFKNDTIHILNDSIAMYKYKLGLVEDNNKMLKESNKHYRNANTKLADANKNLSNKKEE